MTIGTHYVTLGYLFPGSLFSIISQDTINNINFLKFWSVIKLKYVMWEVIPAVSTAVLLFIEM